MPINELLYEKYWTMLDFNKSISDLPALLSKFEISSITAPGL